MNEARETLYRLVREKAILKQDVYHNTLEVFANLKSVLAETVKDISANYGGNDSRVEFHFRDRGDFQAEVKIAGDVLVFYMHTNLRPCHLPVTFSIPTQDIYQRLRCTRCASARQQR